MREAQLVNFGQPVGDFARQLRRVEPRKRPGFAPSAFFDAFSIAPRQGNAVDVLHRDIIIGRAVRRAVVSQRERGAGRHLPHQPNFALEPLEEFLAPVVVSRREKF